MLPDSWPLWDSVAVASSGTQTLCSCWKLMTVDCLFRSSTVKNRIPSTLWEAECTSSFCSSPNPGQTDTHDLNSVPVHQTILVLNRQDGGRCYTASYRSVAVGCTCVRAITNHNWTISTWTWVWIWTTWTSGWEWKQKSPN